MHRILPSFLFAALILPAGLLTRPALAAVSGAAVDSLAVGFGEDAPSAPSPARAELMIKISVERLVGGLKSADVLSSLPASSRLGLHYVRASVFGWSVVTVDLSGGLALQDAVAALAAEPAVAAVEPVKVQHALRVPNDPYYDELWGFSMIGIERAWDMTVGTSSQRIGVVDTGLTRDHVDFAGKDIFGFDFISDAHGAEDGNGRDRDYTDDSAGAHYHGSHVAGTIAARANDETGVAGINWSAGIVTARVLGRDGAGSSLDILEGAAWLAGFSVDGAPDIGNNRVSVINVSLGAVGTCSSMERDVYSQILAAGVSVVVAAGNDGNEVPTASPANCPGVIAVGAFDETGYLSGYSNFDDRIDVVAPGGDASYGQTILSVDGSSSWGWVHMQGTSMAAPHVTGVVSLMQAVNPRLSPSQIRSILADGPYTCDGCDGRRALFAQDAVERAKATIGAGPGGPDSPDDDEAVGECPAHSSLTSDGTGCMCDAGFEPAADMRSCDAVDGGSSHGVTNGQTCDARRGNWDCDKGFGCVDGVCIHGANGTAKFDERCSTDADCDSGLCDDGFCTRPCSDGCPADFTCDEDAIPGGGMCRFAPFSMGCSAFPDQVAKGSGSVDGRRSEGMAAIEAMVVFGILALLRRALARKQIRA